MNSSARASPTTAIALWVDDHADAERLRMLHEVDEIAERSVLVMNTVVIGHVAAVVAVRRRIEGLKPDAGGAEAVAIAVELSLQVRSSGRIVTCSVE